MHAIYHNSFYAMGTRCHMVLPKMKRQLADQIYHVIKQEVHRVETCLSRFIPYSEITIINKKARKESLSVSEEIYEILKTCQKYSTLTAGAFDITLHPLLQYWKEKGHNTEPDSRLMDLLKQLGMEYVSLYDEDSSILLQNDVVDLDLGGFGKGYALAMADKLLHDFSVENAFISFGESSIMTLGSHPAGDHWKVGLNDYLNPGKSVYEFALNNGSVSTSSNFYVDDYGKLHNHRHVINPYTGYPVEDILTVSVRSESPVTAEILSTAILVVPSEKLETIRMKFPSCDIIKVNYSTYKPDVEFYTNNINA